MGATLVPLVLASAPLLPAPAPDPSPPVAEEAFFRVPLAALEVQAGEVPRYTRFALEDWRDLLLLWPRVVLDGGGEGYFLRGGGVPEAFELMRSPDLGGGELFLRAELAPGQEAVTGSLFLPDASWRESVRVDFRVPSGSSDPALRDGFRDAALAWNRRALAEGLSGAAWFRHRSTELAGATSTAGPGPRAVDAESDMVRAYSLFSGGRAVSENLQLERALPTRPGAGDEAGGSVPIAELHGIETPEFDWSSLTPDEAPPLDPLAAAIPADQHALFFPSFDGLVRLADAADAHGALALEAFEERSSDAGTRARYERQLGIALDALARELGSTVVESAALTGSDPYLRTGSDVALLLEASRPEALAAWLTARQEALLEEDVEGVERVEGEVEGVAYRGVVSPGRTICSYLATLGEVAVVTNSLRQLSALARTAGSPERSLASLDEYRFFRERYPLGARDEAGFLVLSDAAIRRWCGPRWRIGAARRVRAAARLAELQAEVAGAVLAGEDGVLVAPGGGPELGELRLGEGGVVSSIHGSLAFQTPIAELDLERADADEARLYERWRDGYQRNWSGVFDPIAASFRLREGELELDLTVMPLIAASDYGELVELSGDTRLVPSSGDPHPGTIVHFVLALDREQGPLQELGRLLAGFLGQAGLDPLGWLGDSVAIWLEDGDVWDRAAEAEDPEEALEDLWLDAEDLPLGMHVAVTSGVKLAAFLGALRTFAEETAPGAARWEPREEDGLRYVRIGSDVTGDEFALYYATPPGALVLTLSEATMLRTLARLGAADTEAEEGVAPAAPSPWPGESAALLLEGPGVRLVTGLLGPELRGALRRASWRNLPILNEWKRLWPERDPLEVHRELWHEELVCPGGGEYVWNDELRTMESSVYGSPGAPREGPALPAPWSAVHAARFGLTFEHDGLRARGVLEEGG